MIEIEIHDIENLVTAKEEMFVIEKSVVEIEGMYENLIAETETGRREIRNLIAGIENEIPGIGNMVAEKEREETYEIRNLIAVVVREMYENSIAGTEKET